MIYTVKYSPHHIFHLLIFEESLIFEILIENSTNNSILKPLTNKSMLTVTNDEKNQWLPRLFLANEID